MDNVTRQEFEDYKREMSQHVHNGYDGGLINFQDILGLFTTTSSTAEFNRIVDTTARVPSKVSEQMFIYNNSGTYKLYVYDSVGKVWKSVTIA